MLRAAKPTILTGIVRRYSGNGRKLGYPTANIRSRTRLDDGVYFGLANLSTYKQWPALIFIGTPTTVGDKGRRVEAHLLDVPDIDYYDQGLELTILHYHRPNQTFQSVDELKSQMIHDEIVGRNWLASHALTKKVKK